jgi:hypothetical protein
MARLNRHPSVTPPRNCSPSGNWIGSVWVTGIALILAACATTPPPPPEHTFRIIVPEVTPLPETEELQRKGGVSVTVAPVTVSVEPYERCEYVPTSSLMALLSRPTSASNDTHKPFEVLRFPTSRLLSGDAVSFVVTITNHMDRVFRGSGALVQFNVDGRVQGTDQSQYEDLLTALIPPGEERQYVIRGVPIGALPGESTLAMDLYDLITGIDQAGNITQRDNFQWYFQVTVDHRVERVAGTRQVLWLPNDQANALTAAQDRGIYRCHDRIR